MFQSSQYGVWGLSLTLLLLSATRLATGDAIAPPSQEIRLTGSFTQGGLLVGQTTPGMDLAFNGRRIRVSPEGVFIIGLGRDAPPVARISMIFPDGHKKTETLSIHQRKYPIQRIDGLPDNQVSPPKAVLARIRTETQLVKAARRLDDARGDFLNGFIWPVEGRISGVYGSQRILNGEPRRPHYGLDIVAPEGTPVRAPANGIVTLAHPDMFLSGGTLILDHGHGLSSSFLHLKRILVDPGVRVRQGDAIAEVGTTGRVTGPHLDWRINWFDVRLDPQLLMKPN